MSSGTSKVMALESLRTVLSKCRKLALEHRPDVHRGVKRSPGFESTREAFVVLLNTETRNQYDEELHKKQTRPSRKRKHDREATLAQDPRAQAKKRCTGKDKFNDQETALFCWNKRTTLTRWPRNTRV